MENEENKHWKPEKFEHTHKDIYTVIFGRLSLEKPNVGKPVQQMRVSLLIFSNNSSTTIQTTKTEEKY